MKILVYTFKSFSFIHELKKFGYKPFVFGKLKDDLPKFLDLVKLENPDLIIGIAKSADNKSHFETIAANVFNSTKKIIKDGAENYLLDCPKNPPSGIEIRKSNTDSFCNWVMYMIAANLDARQQFIHVSSEDMEIVKDYLIKL